MPRRILVKTLRGIRSISTYTQEDLDKKGEKHIMTENQTTITTAFELTEHDAIYKQGSLQGFIEELDNYNITSSKVLTTTDTFFGGEQIHIIPWK